MNKWHITITELDTNEVICDTDTSCIVGAIDEGENVRNLGLTHCNGKDLAVCLKATEEIVGKLKGDVVDDFLKKMLRDAMTREDYNV